MASKPDIASHEETFRHLKEVRAEAIKHARLAQQFHAERRDLLRGLIEKGFSQADMVTFALGQQAGSGAAGSGASWSGAGGPCWRAMSATGAVSSVGQDHDEIIVTYRNPDPGEAAENAS